MENAIHLLKSVNDKQNMSYILTTSEGGVFLIDGGYEDDVPYLLDYLKKIFIDKPIHLDAIWLTHPHVDHIEAFLTLIKNYHHKFDFDHLFYHFPSIYDVKEDKDSYLIEEFNKLLIHFSSKAMIVHRGNEFHIKGADFKVLYTYENHHFDVNTMNNSSLMFKITINNKSILFTGDIGIDAGDIILNQLPKDDLQVDYCQMAHHGQDGPDKSFYEAIKPRLGCFWNSPNWLYNNDLGQGYNTANFKTVIVRNWMKEISPSHVDYCNKDDSIKINL